MAAIDKMTDAQKRALMDVYRVNEAGLAILTPGEIVDGLLRWEGIMGYTDIIMDIIERAYDTRLRPHGW